MLFEQWDLSEASVLDIEAKLASAATHAKSNGDLSYSLRMDVCRSWLARTHRRFADRLLGGWPMQADMQGDKTGALPHSIVFVPKSQPEHAHTVDARDLGNLALAAALSKEEWFMQETAIDTGLGPTGRLQVRLRAEWVIGPPAIRCASLRPRTEPECIVTTTAELPLDAREPRLLGCVICYDDARIAS